MAQVESIVADFSLPEPDGRTDVLVVAGEHSGDQHAAAVVTDLREARPELVVAAVGGPALQQSGAQLLFDLTAFSVVVLVEVLRHYSAFKRLFDALTDWIARHRPRVVVLVDYPGFNLRLAAELQRRGISRKGGGDVVVYQYISPQIWAWKAKRRFRMAQVLDELGVIFPFEVGCYADTSLAVRFVGHPFVDSRHRNPLSYAADGPLVLLPGSRVQAVRRIFPAMVGVVALAAEQGQRLEAVVLYPDAAIRAELEQVIAAHPQVADRIRLQCGGSTRAAAVLSSSGTMSLNCALAGIPGAVVYRAHPLTYFLGRRLVGVRWLGIANLILNREVYPEFIQSAARPAPLLAHVRSCLADSGARGRYAGAAAELAAALSAPGKVAPAERIAAWLD
jgi:lipid-A-disaccharide synthase